MALGQWKPAGRFYWSVFSRAIPPQINQTQSLPSRPDSKLKIISAKYGNLIQGYHDRTVEVSSQIQGDSLSLLIGKELLGDPLPLEGHEKELIVEYVFDGSEVQTAVRPQGVRLILPVDPWLQAKVVQLRGSADLLETFRNEVERQKHVLASAEEKWGWEIKNAKHRAEEELSSVARTEARELIKGFGKLKEMNEAEREESRISLLYILKGDQFGERPTWKWQQQDLFKLKVQYERFCEFCKQAKLANGFPPNGSLTTFQQLMDYLEDAEQGHFPKIASAEET